MHIFKGILFFMPQTIQKQTNNLFAAGGVLRATSDVCERLTNKRVRTSEHETVEHVCTYKCERD